MVNIFPTTIMGEILLWSHSRPLWQSDALRQLIESPKLTKSSVIRFVKLCKMQHGLLSDDDERPEAIPLSRDHISSDKPAENSVALLQISNLSNVNAISNKAKLNFIDPGMTLVYGNNASGKSGYVKVLKKVCRARDPGDEILSDAFSNDPGGKAQASIRYSVSNNENILKWEEGNIPPPDLTNVSVFDTSCGSIYVEDDTDLAFTPFGLDLMRRLAKVCRAVKEALNNEKELLERQKMNSIETPVAEKGTAAYTFVTTINSDTTAADFDKLLLNKKDKAKLKVLEKISKEDLIERLQKLRSYHKRLIRLFIRIRSISETLSENNISELRELKDDLLDKQEAAKTSADILFSNEPLKGIGLETWRLLWEAARKYSNEIAYINDSFPVTSNGARCVLCLQTLKIDESEDAKERLNRFEEFIKDDLKGKEKTAQDNFNKAVDEFHNLPISSDDDEDTISEIALENHATAEVNIEFLVSAHEISTSILKCCKKGNMIDSESWDEIKQLSPSPDISVAEIIKVVWKNIKLTKKAQNSIELEAMLKELKELQGREWLETIRDDVLEEINRKMNLELIDKCIADTDTGQITRKTTELNKKAVTRKVKGLFRSELNELGLNHLTLEMVPKKGKYGAQLFRIRFANSDTPVPKVASEGEFRCIALAAFLTELATAEHKSALIFDDPVCSLDHDWRQNLAERLVKEAHQRQIVVFTHDIVFACDIMDLADKKALPLRIQYIYRDFNNRIGCIEESLPWRLNSAQNNIEKLDKLYAKLRDSISTISQDDLETSVKSIYGRIRDTWERVIEEDALLNTVVRYKDWIRPTENIVKLSAMEYDDLKTLHDAYQKCCTVLSHDFAKIRNMPLPDLKMIKADINLIKSWRDTISKKQKNITYTA